MYLIPYNPVRILAQMSSCVWGKTNSAYFLQNAIPTVKHEGENIMLKVQHKLRGQCNIKCWTGTSFPHAEH